jgi:hypothetical protein
LPIVGVEHVGSTAVASLAKPVINCGIVAAERYVLMDHRWPRRGVGRIGRLRVIAVGRTISIDVA